MRPAVAMITLGFGLSACASYVSPDSDANYDAIKTATEQCQAKGGHLQLKSGFDGRRLSDYDCRDGEAK